MVILTTTLLDVISAMQNYMKLELEQVKSVVQL